MYHSSIKQTDTRSLADAPERINSTTRIRDWKKCYVDTDKKSHDNDVILRVRVRFPENACCLECGESVDVFMNS